MPDVLFLWIHLLAAIGWVGGMLFLSLVLAPLVRHEATEPAVKMLFRSAARRFRALVWAAIVVLAGSGPVLLHSRRWSLIDPNGWPRILQIKIGLVVLW